MTESEVTAIVSRMKELEDQQIDIDNERETLWERFNEIANDQEGEGVTFRHFNPNAPKGKAGSDGWVMERTFANNAPAINVKALEEGIDRLDEITWVDVTDQVRTLSDEKLEKMAAKYPAVLKLIKEVTEQKPPTLRKSSKGPTKADLKSSAK